MKIRYQDTICALATPRGKAALAVIRCSGAKAVSVVEGIIRNRSGRPVKLRKSHRVYYAVVVDAQEAAIDEVLVLFMRGPRSFTGEDVVEIHCHGGLMQWRSIIELLCKNDIRIAEPGEFTQRAFLNGRISLLQAEAVNEMIQVETLDGARAAARHCLGETTGILGRLRRQLLDVMAHVQAIIDFPDDLGTEDGTLIVKKIRGLQTELEKIADTFARGRVLRDGLKVVITGKSNVGKSSLFNALLKDERAIVTHIPGTTRDVLEEKLLMDGWCFTLVDTAGQRPTECPIEREGLKRADIACANADILIEVFDLTEPFGIRADNERNDEKPEIVVGNKSDLLPLGTMEHISDYIIVSAVTGEGLSELRKALVEKACNLFENPSGRNMVLLNERQRDAVNRAAVALKRCTAECDNSGITDITIFELNEAAEALAELIGEVTSSQVIEQIFSKFCLGK